MEKKHQNVSLRGFSFVCQTWNVYRSAPIPRNLPCPLKFLVTGLIRNKFKLIKGLSYKSVWSKTCFQFSLGACHLSEKNFLCPNFFSDCELVNMTPFFPFTVLWQKSKNFSSTHVQRFKFREFDEKFMFL